MRRVVIALSIGGLFTVVSCSGGSPTSPSAGGATITGTVVRATAAPSSPLTVSVAGTTMSSSVDGSGAFQFGGVPAGEVQLVFRSPETQSTISLSNVVDEDVIEVQVALAGGTATLERQVRGNSALKVLLCHRTNDGSYELIDVNLKLEAARRADGDAAPGELVPADPSKVFDEACRLISPVEIAKFTNGQDANQTPGPTIPIGNPVSWTYVITNRSRLTFTSLSVTDDRGVDVACPRTLPEPGASLTCTGSGTAEAGQYRNVGTVTVTAKGKQFTASDVSHYFGVPVSGVSIKKYTNGQHVDQAPGPSIPVGSPISWTYVVTNTGASTFTSLSVTDDRGVAVACPKTLPAPGASITCTGLGTAVAGQYRNVGTVVATANGTTYTDSDASYYFGESVEDTKKVEICHRTGNGSYHLIDISVNAEPAHRAHGDARPGEPVPGNPGHVFTASCAVK